MDKKALMSNFQAKPDRYWKVSLFKKEGFKRRRCTNCGKFFWTLTDQETCNDASCRPYDFIGNPPTKKRLDFIETWNAIEKFFKRNGHESVEPYPVVCKWFPLYFTLAGIVDFYRMSGDKLDFETGANPTIMTQPCLRFNDIPNVGLNARSFTCFHMVQQTSFYGAKGGYWKDRCIELDYEMLTKVFGINPEEIAFLEDVWVGPNAFGSSLEYAVRGLELGNAVFTEFAGTPERFETMKTKIIDMGAGHERLTWITNGTPTSYDCAFGDVMKKIKKACNIEYDKTLFEKYARLSGVLNVDENADLKKGREEIAEKMGADVDELERDVVQLEAAYAVADHARALLYALSEAGLPSNVGGGYNLRVVLRRALGFIDKYNWPLDLKDVVLWHVKDLRKLNPAVGKNKDEILRILESEGRRHEASKVRASRIIESRKGGEISADDLRKLYESDGVTPEQLGLEAPSGFYESLTQKHMKEATVAAGVDVSGLEKTKLLFRQDEKATQFNARVLKSSGDWVILDQTLFYPESGGQMYDRGTLNGIDVTEVKVSSGVVLHRVAEKILSGAVRGEIDPERRKAITIHHTATHIIGGAARAVLGKHVWQGGSEKTAEHARLDITHFQNLTPEEVLKIEDAANRIVAKNVAIRKSVMKRGDAEKKYGFTIYQGGPVPEKELRIVEIPGFDVEACGGTHCDRTGDVEAIKIKKTERIADGIVRLEYVAGKLVWDEIKKKEELIRRTAEALSVQEDHLPETAKRIFEEWKERGKEIEKLRKETAYLKTENIKSGVRNNRIFKILPYERKQLIEIADAIAGDLPNVLVVLANPGGDVVGKRGAKSYENVLSVVRDVCNSAGGAAGGKENFAQGSGDLSKIIKIFEEKGA